MAEKKTTEKKTTEKKTAKKKMAEKEAMGSRPDLEEATEKSMISEDLEKAEEAEHSFSKEQLLSSKRFKDRRDLVEALLDDGELYTVKAVEEKIESYMKGKVK